MSTILLVPTLAPFEAAAETLMPHLYSGQPSTRTIAAKCLGLLAGYHHRWKNAPYRIDAVECVVTSDLYNPATKSKSRTFVTSGKIDVTATELETLRRVIFDHKTTSEDISDPNSPYWRQLVVESQPTHYQLIEWLNGRKADYAIWDVVKKPQTRPAKILGKKDREAICFSGRYCGQELTPAELDQFRATETETARMYASRLIEDATIDRPHWYFQRRAIPRMDKEVLEYAGELWDEAQDIILARRNNRHPRNSGACMLYKTPCKFLGICSGHDSIDSGNWTRRSWVHPELPVLANTDGKDILTNSRISTFRTCRRKHYLQYEVGLERFDEDEREALFFGTLWHSALEQYFLALQQQQRNN